MINTSHTSLVQTANLIEYFIYFYFIQLLKYYYLKRAKISDSIFKHDYAHVCQFFVLLI